MRSSSKWSPALTHAGVRRVDKRRDDATHFAMSDRKPSKLIVPVPALSTDAICASRHADVFVSATKRHTRVTRSSSQRCSTSATDDATTYTSNTSQTTRRHHGAELLLAHSLAELLEEVEELATINLTAAVLVDLVKRLLVL